MEMSAIGIGHACTTGTTRLPSSAATNAFAAMLRSQRLIGNIETSPAKIIDLGSTSRERRTGTAMLRVDVYQCPQAVPPTKRALVFGARSGVRDSGWRPHRAGASVSHRPCRAIG